MSFSSIPLYLDSPNWQQHTNQQILQGSHHHDDQNQHLIPAPPPGQSHAVVVGGGGLGGQAIRPNSMTEKARLNKIFPSEAPLKCPRCESTNTKFCYYNNYNLQQPRHYCKGCRRYWTFGGALRNVPVGGGCRRNKKPSKSSSGGGRGGGGSCSSSKSSLTSQTSLVGGDRVPLNLNLVTTTGFCPTITTTGIPSAGGGGGTGISSFMASLQNIAQLGMGNLGLSFGGPPHPLGGLGGLTSGAGAGAGAGADHLDFPQLHPNPTNPQVQFPNFLGGFEIPGSSNGVGLYTSFQDDNQANEEHQQGTNSLSKNCSSEFVPIKSEDDGQGLNLHKQFINNNNNSAINHQFWAGNNGATTMWTNLSSLNSSASHLL